MKAARRFGDGHNGHTSGNGHHRKPSESGPVTEIESEGVPRAEESSEVGETHRPVNRLSTKESPPMATTTTRPAPKHGARNDGAGARPQAEAQQTQAEAQQGEEQEVDEKQARRYVMQRETNRRIRLHTRRQIMTSVDEAVVKKVDGKPDMRFAENRLGLMRDPSKKKDGNPDFRFVEHRPDILAVHAARGETFPNLLFDEDGTIDEDVAGAEVDAGEQI